MKLKLWIATDKVGSKMYRTVKVDDEDWAILDDRGKDEYAWSEIQNLSMVSWGYEEDKT